MKIKIKIKQYGVINSIRRAVKSLLRRIGFVYESYYLMVNNININEVSLKLKQFDYSSVKELTFEDFEKGDKSHFTTPKMELLKSRFYNDDYKAYGILKRGVLVCSGWINTEELHYPRIFEKSFPLKNNEGLLIDAYCHPDYRGRGFHYLINLYSLLKLYEMKRTKIFVIILSENIPAFKTQKKSGFKMLKKIRFVKIFNKTLLSN